MIFVVDVVAYDEPILRAALQQNTTLANMYMVIPGTDEQVLASAQPSEHFGDVRPSVSLSMLAFHSVLYAALTSTFFFAANSDAISFKTCSPPQ